MTWILRGGGGGGGRNYNMFGAYGLLHITGMYYPGQKNRYSREIHEVDLQFNHVMSCDIDLRFNIDATHGICAPRARVADRSRCRMISYDRTAHQSHEYLSCNGFFGQGSSYELCNANIQVDT